MQQFVKPHVILDVMRALAPEWDYSDVELVPGEWQQTVCPVHASGKKNACVKITTSENPYDPGVLWCFPCGRHFTPVDLVMELKGLAKKQAWVWLEQHGFCEKGNTRGGLEGSFTSML